MNLNKTIYSWRVEDSNGFEIASGEEKDLKKAKKMVKKMIGENK